MEADTDAIMGEEPPTTGSTSGETATSGTDSKTNEPARSTSSQSMQKSKEQPTTGSTTSGAETEVTKKESGSNSIKENNSTSAGGI